MPQGDLTRFRWLRVDTAVAARALAPVAGLFGTGTQPDFTISPFTIEDMPTTGILFELQQPSAGSATAGAGGFTVTLWIRDPNTGRWASAAALSASYAQIFTTFDFDACEVFFQITNVGVAGLIDIGIAEQ